jgi:hypothetical protein
LHNFLNSDEDVDNPESEHASLQKRVGHDGAESGIQVEKVIILPNAQPGQKEKKAPYLQAVSDVENMPNPGHA